MPAAAGAPLALTNLKVIGSEYSIGVLNPMTNTCVHKYILSRLMSGFTDG
jgi:hypothetical protein